MVEFIENTAKQSCVCKTDKLATDIHIRKSNDGFIFFEFHFEKGLVPKELSGKYSSIPKAKQAITQYLKNKKPSKTLRRREFAEDFDRRKRERDAAKLNSEDSK